MMYNRPENADEVVLAATVRKQEGFKKHKIHCSHPFQVVCRLFVLFGFFLTSKRDNLD